MKRLARRSILLVTLLAALTIPSIASAGWSTYFGTGTFLQPSLGGPAEAWSGWNYHTSNRVYRPIGHPFFLAYYNSSGAHWSATNWDTNPFYFGAYGYNQVGCLWEYYNDSSSTVYPVTCQGYS